MGINNEVFISYATFMLRFSAIVVGARWNLSTPEEVMHGGATRNVARVVSGSPP